MTRQGETWGHVRYLQRLFTTGMIRIKIGISVANEQLKKSFALSSGCHPQQSRVVSDTTLQSGVLL